MLFIDNDNRKLEKALIGLAAISLEESMPQVNLFYDQKIITRLIKIAD